MAMSIHIMLAPRVQARITSLTGPEAHPGSQCGGEDTYAAHAGHNPSSRVVPYHSCFASALPTLHQSILLINDDAHDAAGGVRAVL